MGTGWEHGVRTLYVYDQHHGWEKRCEVLSIGLEPGRELDERIFVEIGALFFSGRLRNDVTEFCEF
jgi:hypothetical protein